MKQALIVFVRKPELGKVKTRLAATIGNEKALQIYLKLLHHTQQIVAASEIDSFIFYGDEIVSNDIWDNPNIYKQLQANGDLGLKMKTAFETVFAKGYNKVVIIGSDCYELTTAIVLDAFTALQNNNVVIGKAVDGGYYLLGMQQLYAVLFENKKWSTNTVAANTIQDCINNNLSFWGLPLLNDVDEEKDVPEGWL